MTDPTATATATALIHELRNALVPLDFKLERGTATLDDARALVKRLFDFADELARDLNTPPEDLEVEGRARAEAILAAADVYRAGMEDPSVDAEQVEAPSGGEG